MQTRLLCKIYRPDSADDRCKRGGVKDCVVIVPWPVPKPWFGRKTFARLGDGEITIDVERLQPCRCFKPPTR